jgi:FKBP-type peptidyl-prolyl cis-trans isomerase FklB
MTIMMMLRSLLFLSLPLLAIAGTNQEGLDYLAETAKQPDVISLPSGLQYKVLTKGEGKYHPTPNSPCSCHYEGKLISGDVFDSSYERGSPTSFAPNQVIKGWTEAMQLMVEGDKWEMYIPSELAYGDGGSGAKIPGGSVLVFIMEIQEINGEKVPALTCEVVTGEGCNEKETAYLAKMKEKSSEDQKKQLDRLNGMVGQKMTADLQDWIRRRIYILALLTKIEEQEL